MNCPNLERKELPKGVKQHSLLQPVLSSSEAPLGGVGFKVSVSIASAFHSMCRSLALGGGL